jgi:hypothetical protein
MTKYNSRLRQPFQKRPKTEMPRQVSKSQVESWPLEALYPTNNQQHRLDADHMMQMFLLRSMFRTQYVSYYLHFVFYLLGRYLT